VAAVVLPFRHQVMGIVTSDVDVQQVGAWLLPAVMLNILGGVAVQVGTGGVLTSQGRPGLVTFLSMGFELPLSLGSVALLVLLFKASVTQVYWVQAAVTCLEAVVVWLLVTRSNWRKFSNEAVARQLEGSGAASPAAGSPAQAPAADLPSGADADEVAI